MRWQKLKKEEYGDQKKKYEEFKRVHITYVAN